MKTASLFIVLPIAFALAACAPMAKALPTQTVAATLAPTAAERPTATPRPTQTPTPTPEPYAIDMEKFHTMPASYEYLLAHPDEFVQSPDPLTDRIAFDKWWLEKLVPSVGYEVWGRDVTLKMDGLSEAGNRIDTGVNAEMGAQLLSSPQFFWFENTGTIYPVTIFNIQMRDITPGKPNITMALVLCNGPGRVGTDALERISSGEGIRGLSIITQRLGEADVIINMFVDAGFSPKLDMYNLNAPPVFGPSIIRFPWQN